MYVSVNWKKAVYQDWSGTFHARPSRAHLPITQRARLHSSLQSNMSMTEGPLTVLGQRTSGESVRAQNGESGACLTTVKQSGAINGPGVAMFNRKSWCGRCLEQHVRLRGTSVLKTEPTTKDVFTVFCSRYYVSSYGLHAVGTVSVFPDPVTLDYPSLI